MLIIKYLPVLILLFLACLGACIGSFAALVIERLPKESSIVYPFSHCSSCNNSLSWWQKIPILSWLILGGACYYCHKSIGLRLIIIECIFLFFLPALYLKYGFSIAMIEKIPFFFLLICISYIDIDTFYIPISLLILLIIWAVLVMVVYHLFPGEFVAITSKNSLLEFLVFKRAKEYSIVNQIAGGALGLTVFSVINLSVSSILRKLNRLAHNQWAMGWGDPLLVMAIGLFVGASHLFLVIFLASFTGAIVGIISNILWQQNHNHQDIPNNAMPFGPFLALAAIYVYLI